MSPAVPSSPSNYRDKHVPFEGEQATDRCVLLNEVPRGCFVEYVADLIHSDGSYGVKVYDNIVDRSFRIQSLP